MLWLSIHHLMDVWFASFFWLLWMMLLWTFPYKVLGEHRFSFFLAVHLGEEFLGHVVTMFSISEGLADCLLEQLHTLRLQQPWIRAPVSPPCSHLLLSIMLLFHLSRYSLIPFNNDLELSQYKLFAFSITFITT